MVGGRGVFCVCVALAVAPLAAQNTDIVVSGRLDSSFNLLAPDPSASALAPGDPAFDADYPNSGSAAAAWTALGIVRGNLGFSGGSKEVKTEIRLGLDSYPQAALSLDRAMVRFRFPGLRGSLGLGRIAWGSGFVYVPGDLLFDSTDLAVNLGSSEIRSSGTWLADVFVSLDDESFIETAVLAPDPEQLDLGAFSIPYPPEISRLAGGVRISAAPGGVTLEAAYAADGKNRLHKIALSTQFNAGVDIYLSLRADLPFVTGESFELGPWLSASAGVFGTAKVSEELSVSTRHEALVRPWHSWVPGTVEYTGAGPSDRAAADPASPPGTSGQGLPYALYSYHELRFSLADHIDIGLRALFSPVDLSVLAMAETGWSPLQNLRLYLRAGVQGGDPGDTYRWAQPGSASIGIGASASL